MRVAKPRVVMRRAMVMGSVARWVISLPPLPGFEVAYDGLGLLLGRIELVILHIIPKALFYVGLFEARPPDLLVEFQTQRLVGQSPVDYDLASVEAQKMAAGAPEVEGRKKRRQHQNRRHQPDERYHSMAQRAQPLSLRARGWPLSASRTNASGTHWT